MTERVQIGPGFSREITEGETWAPHAGGIVVCHPERKPLWCHMVGGAYVQEWLEPSGPDIPATLQSRFWRTP